MSRMLEKEVQFERWLCSSFNANTTNLKFLILKKSRMRKYFRSLIPLPRWLQLAELQLATDVLYELYCCERAGNHVFLALHFSQICCPPQTDFAQVDRSSILQEKHIGHRQGSQSARVSFCFSHRPQSMEC